MDALGVGALLASPDPREVRFDSPDATEVSAADFDGPLLQAEDADIDLSGRRPSASTRGAVDHDEMVQAARALGRRPDHAEARRVYLGVARAELRTRAWARTRDRSRGRSRAARCGAGRTKGSRRRSARSASRSGSRGDPDPESDPFAAALVGVAA